MYRIILVLTIAPVRVFFAHHLYILSFCRMLRSREEYFQRNNAFSLYTSIKNDHVLTQELESISGCHLCLKCKYL
jgi:hypothetical protein